MKVVKLQRIGILTTATLLFGALVVFGQKRSVDLEVICVSPADTVINGIGERLRFGMQNNGPDTLFNQDTILYWLYVFENDSTGYVVYNGATLGTTAGFVPIGDARYYNDNYAIRFPFPERPDTFTVEFCVVIGSSYIDGQGDTIHPFGYIDPDKGNNMCCTSITIIPKPLPSSILSAEDENALKVYPNPVRDILHIRTPLDWSGDELLVSLWDISGRQVLKQTYSQNVSVLGDVTLDVSGLSDRIYQLRLQSEEGVESQKVVISR